MAKDFFEKPFDESTLIKLELFENYLNECIPVFIKNAINFKTLKGVNIFDFFAGAGKDSDGKNGSPLIAIKSIPFHFPDIIQHNLTVSVHLNEFEHKYFKKLEEEVIQLGLESKPINIHLENEDFVVLFEKWYKKMLGCANFVWLDQFGVKYINSDIFNRLVSLPMTDLLFFVSSSTFKRFAEDENIRRVLNISKDSVKDLHPHQIHRFVAETYRALIPSNKEYYLTSFSIKKKTNIYGLIFGSNHPLGLEKFLKVCWGVNPNIGDANFDIDEDNIERYTNTLFPVKPKKLTLFEEELEKEILNGKLKTEWDVYIFTLTNGFLGNIHAKTVVDKLKNEKKIEKETFSYAYSTLGDRRKQGIIKKIKIL